MGVIWKAIFWTTPGFLDRIFLIKCGACKCGKQMSSAPRMSHSNHIFTICHVKAQTHSNTVGMHTPTGDFGQKWKIKVTLLIGLGLGLGCMSHCSIETVMIAHRLGDFVVNPL